MANKVSNKSNLNKGNAVRKQGYKSLLDKHRDVQRRFVELHQQGMQMKVIRQTLIKEFPKVQEAKEIPSVQQLAAYVRNNLTTTAEVTVYLPKYAEMLKEYDVIKKTYDLVVLCDQQLQKHIKAQSSTRIITTWVNMCMTANEKFDDMMKRHGVYQENAAAGQSAGLTNNGTINLIGMPKELMTEILVSERSYAELRKNQEKLLKEGGINARTVIS